MQFFKDSPRTNILLGHALFKNLEKVTKKYKGSKTSDLFLVKRDQTFEFIHKHSWRGRWLGFKIAVKRIFFEKKNDSLAIENNLRKVAGLFEASNEVKFFDQIANDLGQSGEEITSQKLQEEFKKLRDELENLKLHVQQKRVEKKRNIQSIKQISLPPFAIKTHQAAAPFFHDLKVFNAESGRLLTHIFKDRLTEEQKSEIISLLFTDVDINEIIEGMKKAQNEADPLRSISLEPLRLSLMKGLAYVSEEKTAAIFAAVEHLNPPMPKKDQEFNFQLRQFVMAFGDRFIKNSGLEGDLSSRPYIELMGEFIQSRGFKSQLASQMSDFLSNFIDLRESKCSSEDLRREIKKTLAASSHERKKCLLIGGWVGHAIVYEIEKQTDGRYAFRIFNKGQGSELADQLEEAYHSKVAGCISVKNIRRSCFLKRIFSLLCKPFLPLMRMVLKAPMRHNFSLVICSLCWAAKKRALTLALITSSCLKYPEPVPMPLCKLV